MRQQKSRRVSAPSVPPQNESSGDSPASSTGDSPVKSPARRRANRKPKPGLELPADAELEPSAVLLTALEAVRRERDEARAGLAAAQQEIQDLQQALEAGRLKQKAGDDAFRRFSDSGLIGIGLFDRDGRIEYANPALREMLGLSEDESERGLSWSELAGPEFAGLVARGFEELKSQGGCTPFEARYSRKDGGHFWALFFGVLFGENSAAAFILDITRRRELEEVSTGLNHELQQRVTELQRLGSIVESSQDAILTKTLDGIITSWNRGAQRLYGYRPEEIIGRPVSILAPPGLQREMDLILDHIGTGERVETGETQRVTKDGRRLDISVTVSPLWNAAGELVGASSIARDITRQKQLQRDLQERNEQIETQAEELEAQYEELQVQHEELGRQDRQRNEFLAMLAHELRNPLAPIMAAAEVMRLRGLDDPQLDRQREIIARQVRHLVRLVDDLLDVARIVQGKVALRREMVNLADVIDHALQICNALIDERGHRLTVSLPPEALWVEGDPTRLVQVVCNLLNNAARYTDPRGQIWLTVDAEPGMAALRHSDNRGTGKAGSTGTGSVVTGTVVLRVRDSGRGIPPELLSSIFDIFVQADRSLARSEGGLGVGLTLARSLVEQHAGVITVFSDGLNRGSEFIVRLPSLTPLQSLAALGGDAVRSPTGSRRIVVVDDNVDALETLTDLLVLEGHTVWAAASGPEAIALAAEHDPDVLLVDIGMPGMDGYEVARCILSDPSLRHISMAAVTGYGCETDPRASPEAGFRYHLTKPVEIETLREVLRQL